MTKEEPIFEVRSGSFLAEFLEILSVRGEWYSCHEDNISKQTRSRDLKSYPALGSEAWSVAYIEASAALTIRSSMVGKMKW